MDILPGLQTLFLQKDECVIHLPRRMLPAGRINAYRSMDRPAIVEMAGRDSVAAAIRAVREMGFTDLVPTYAYTGTEHGPWETVPRAVERLADQVPEVRVHDLLLLGSPRFWNALNGRYVGELVSRYGFYSPCIGCHLYLHSVRIPLARILGGLPIISGERERHNGSVKVNQASEALDAYERLCAEFGIRLLLPLRSVSDGRRIEEILGFEWKQDEEQLSCVLSGNYRLLTGQVAVRPEQTVRFLEEFALPLAREVVASYVEGTVPSHSDIAAAVFGTM